jgi:hypothetical protein
MAKKKSWLEIISEPAQQFKVPTLFSSDNSDDTDGGGCNGAHSTCSTKGPWNSHSIGTVDSIHTDDSHIRNLDTHNNCIDRPDNQIQLLRPRFRLKPERQNAARERKPIRTPSMQLTVAFSL